MGPRSIASHRVQGTIFVESAVPQQVLEESGGERWGPTGPYPLLPTLLLLLDMDPSPPCLYYPGD